MRDIVLIGLNHKTAAVELRERIAFSKDEVKDALGIIQKYPSIEEILLLSTCNRVEVLIISENTRDAANDVKSYIHKNKNIPLDQFDKALYVHKNEEAVRHVFRVASSLDSMIVGEPQILGQIKEAYQIAASLRTTGPILTRLMNRTFFVAKRVRNETGIGDHAVSISYAAIELGKKIFDTLEGKKALLIGAGEMAELSVEHLIRNKADDIYVANRTFERGVELAAKFKGKAVRFEEISECLGFVNIVISSTGSPDIVITRDQVKSVMRLRRNKSIFFIDIAVPRDIDPAINKISNAYVYDIDDLKGIIDKNIEERHKEALKGERIIDEAVILFRQWLEGLEVVPTIKAMRGKVTTIAKAEAEKTTQSLAHLSEKDRESIHKMAETIVNKILHHPTLLLKEKQNSEDRSFYLEITRQLFKIDD